MKLGKLSKTKRGFRASKTVVMVFYRKLAPDPRVSLAVRAFFVAYKAAVDFYSVPAPVQRPNISISLEVYKH